MKNKYNAKRTKVDGITFASMLEAARYVHLRNARDAGRIENLELQTRYEFPINGEPLRYCASKRKVVYRPDFEFDEEGKHRVIDVKGMDTPMSKLKRALMKACHGIDVEVVR